jgi:hypothetical protein
MEGLLSFVSDLGHTSCIDSSMRAINLSVAAERVNVWIKDSRTNSTKRIMRPDGERSASSTS